MLRYRSQTRRRSTIVLQRVQYIVLAYVGYPVSRIHWRTHYIRIRIPRRSTQEWSARANQAF
jgi:hypothetical protein